MLKYDPLIYRLEIPLMEMAIKSFMFRVHMGWDAVHAEEYLKWGQQQRILALQSLMAKGNAADIQMYHMYMSMFIREIRYVPGDVERLHPLLLVPNTAVLKNFFHVGGADLAVKNVKRPHEVAFPPRSMLEEDPSPDPTVPLKVRVKENGKLDY